MLIRRPPLDDDDESPDRWLVSYADFITLLFAFFVVMYSISSVNQGKYNELMSSMGMAFSGQGAAVNLKTNRSNPNLNSKAQNQADSLIKPLPLTYLHNEKIRKERESMTNMGADLANKLSPLIKEGKVRVMQNTRGIRIDINDSLLFTPGSAELAAAASTVINEIAPLLKDNERLIQVEGHTDNIAIHNDLFYSNWELSAVRASSVVRMLSDTGIAEARLSALGFGATQPITENSTELGRAKNRRVSIMVLSDLPNQKEAALEITPKTIAK
ncbi:MAG: flagellar motor protein MotD [Methylotenera sp.]|uniref:flagellar motor protein MotD n=1 Tax=Methylotenera sp. TaxID=2051956 RepID=UPI00248A50C9|nr:flagellar motor protein MotD [Methylotenera sp.]MDI1308034.1 flagellar motor protein MotD [Methylotenera sp.]